MQWKALEIPQPDKTAYSEETYYPPSTPLMSRKPRVASVFVLPVTVTQVVNDFLRILLVQIRIVLENQPRKQINELQ